VPADVRLTTEHRPGLLRGVTVIIGTASDTQGRSRPLTAIPYYAWAHRGPGEMAVWLPTQK
jgi:DUF1680 family protein